jgi:F plasmid transfer operon, TraF, protein
VVRRTLGVAAVIVAASTGSIAHAQTFEAAGIRAQGMGGAFVAVADDATAVYWNPGAMATVGLVNAVVERSDGRLGRVGFDAGGRPFGGMLGLQDETATLVAVGAPPVGVAYYRLRSTGFAGSLAADRPAGPGAVLTTDNIAMNLLQSLADGVHVGASLRLVRGSAASGFVEGGDAGAVADAARDLEGRGSWAFDVDAGVLVARGRWRAGLTARNLVAPSFETTIPDVELSQSRQVRAGVAFLPRASTTLALDADLTETQTAIGDVRRLALGVEQTLVPRLVVRGGFHVNTVDEARPAAAFGASVLLGRSIWVDAQATVGAHDAERRWGVGLRLGL